ncbi:MAG: thioredoxin family protein [Candidatus Nanoarchaeia archaeon]
MWIFTTLSVIVFLVLNVVLSLRISEYRADSMSSPSNISEGKTYTQEKTDTKEACPDAEGGSENAPLQVKYFYTRFCPWCKKEEPILRKMVENHGDMIHIDWYDLNSCPELARKYSVSGVPTLIFSTIGNKTEYSHYGFVYERDLMKLLCEVAGRCLT